MRLFFAEFAFDTEERCLSCSGTPVHLTPKGFCLLEILLENRPKAVSKRALMDHLWPETNVSEGSLATLVSEVRKALGEKSSGSRFIRTVHSFGYAFHGPATEAARGLTETNEPTRFELVSPSGNFILHEGENWIGREGATVCIDSNTVSRRHARITVRAGRALIADLQSKNGTFVGGVRLRDPLLLKDGDEIRVGSVKLILNTSRLGETATMGD